MATQFGSFKQPTPKWAKVIARIAIGLGGLAAFILDQAPFTISDMTKLHILEWSGFITASIYYFFHLFHYDMDELPEESATDKKTTNGL